MALTSAHKPKLQTQKLISKKHCIFMKYYLHASAFTDWLKIKILQWQNKTRQQRKNIISATMHKNTMSQLTR